MAIIHSTYPTPSVLMRVSLSFLPELNHWAESRRRRQIRHTYGEMSNAQLWDIGLTPWDVAVALSLPLEKSAGDAIVAAAEDEAARW